MKETSVIQWVATLGSENPGRCDFTPDMRDTRAKRLKDAAHPSHIVHRYQRRSGRYGSFRDFVSGDFYTALTMSETRFNRVVKALPAFRKLTQ